MKKIFEPSDFWKDAFNPVDYQRIADAANAKLEKLMSEWPVVYFSSENALGEIQDTAGLLIGKKVQGDTHKARLAFIGPIKRECLVHEPDKTIVYNYTIVNSTCKHCDVELIAEWKET